MTRARDRDLPELELLALDEEEPVPSASTVDVKSKRWWPIAVGAAVLAAAILVTGHDGGSQVASAPTTPSTPSTLFTPATDSPGARAAADAVRASYPAVLMSRDATALIVLARGGAFEVDVAQSPDTIAGYVARPPGTVVALSNGLVHAYSRMYPDGLDLGSARGVFPSEDPARVWLSGVVDGNAAVKEMPVNGTVPPQLATGFIRLPEGYEVAGVAGKRLVLSSAVKSLGPYEILTWDPETRTTDFVTQRGSLLAAGDDSVAWTLPGCADCGIYVRRGRHDPHRQGGTEPRPVGAGSVLNRRQVSRGGDHGRMAGRRHGGHRPRRRGGRPRWSSPVRPAVCRDARHPLDDPRRDDLVQRRRAAGARHQ